jgi:ubiquinone/menaquinone biosynthesis C-methylase UbiE
MALAETEQLTRMISGAALSRAICSIGELGIADHIAAGVPQPVEALARLTGTHERSLYRLLRFTAGYGIFREMDGRNFDQTPLSAALRTDAQGSFRPAAQMFHRMFPVWEGLDHSIRTGESGAIKVLGEPMFDYIGHNPELGPLFDAGMTAFHGHETPAMLDAYDFSGIKTLADIGGGNGTLLAAVLRRYPQLHGILFDLGHVVSRASAGMQAPGLDRRCKIIEGNFFESLPSGADAYLMRHIIHDWTDEQSIRILRNCRKVIPPDGRVLLVEFTVPAANQASLGKDADMMMMTFPGGMERTEQEYQSLFEHSGFQLSKVTTTKSAVSVVEGRPTDKEYS